LIPTLRSRLDVLVKLLDVLLVMAGVERFPCPRIALCVEEQNVVNPPVLLASLLGVAVSKRPLPDYLRPVVLRAEYGVHHQLQVMAGRIVAVKVD
jgi:hypothetical protein